MAAALGLTIAGPFFRERDILVGLMLLARGNLRRPVALRGLRYRGNIVINHLS